MKTTAVLNKFFNDGSHGREKVSLAEFAKELKELSREEKIALADEAAVELGVPHEPSVK